MPTKVPLLVMITKNIKETCLICLSSKINYLVESNQNVMFQIEFIPKAKYSYNCICKSPKPEPMNVDQFLSTIITSNLVTSISLPSYPNLESFISHKIISKILQDSQCSIHKFQFCCIPSAVEEIMAIVQNSRENVSVKLIISETDKETIEDKKE